MIIKSWGQQVLNTKSTRLKGLARNNYIRIRRLAGIGLYRSLGSDMGNHSVLIKRITAFNELKLLTIKRAIQLLSMLKVSIHDLCHRRFGCQRKDRASQ